MGRSAARQLAERGANVILVSRSASKLEEAMAEAKVRTIYTHLSGPIRAQYCGDRWDPPLTNSPPFSSVLCLGRRTQPAYPALPLHHCRRL